MTEAQIRAILAGTLEGLAYLHSRHKIHRWVVIVPDLSMVYMCLGVFVCILYLVWLAYVWFVGLFLCV